MPKRAVVQQPRRFVERAGADAHHRCDAGTKRGDADLRRLLHGECAVLHVHEQEVVPRGSGQHRCGAAAQMMQPESERDLTLPQLALRDVVDDCHDVPPHQSFARLPFFSDSSASSRQTEEETAPCIRAHHDVAVIGPGEHEPRAHADIARCILLVVDAAHAQHLAVLPARSADGCIGVDHLRMTHLARRCPVRTTDPRCRSAARRCHRPRRCRRRSSPPRDFRSSPRSGSRR